jgi:adenosine kinase
MEGREITPGGAALNSARACNYMLQKNGFDGEVAFVGCIGNDESGRILRKCLEDVKMPPCFAVCEETATGRCAVMVKEKERTLCANIGASQKYPTSHLEAHLDMFKKTPLIYTTGFFITSNDEALKKVCEFASSNNTPLAFNIAAVFLLIIAKDSVMNCIEHADYTFCNEDEASAYGKIFGIDETDRVASAIHMASSKKANTQRPRVSIITQGSAPVIVATCNHDGTDTTIKEYEIPKIPKEKIVDTNGAGDSFVGGFLAALSQGKSVEECVHAGIALSAQVVQRLGCTFE